ncbi:hypothetical protein ACRYCC_25365 [Actinomadura scrupuli]|uniref:hypothetical protein n=1 Tax=Actinomadura scrupuli TaxID=559629 RepID=UPI003D9893BC
MARSKDSDDRDRSEDKPKVDWSDKHPYRTQGDKLTGAQPDDDDTNSRDEYRSDGK